MNAYTAIDRSISHNEIVHLDYNYSDETALIAESEDFVENGDVTEYWGIDSDGSEWRVHMAVSK